ncbi:hypothetical protein COEREDRAFT_87637 [Coemansia reversa NRRL 1564]|uniref:Uncharacterized protein n=1 Tax=Coemansia reversa (strain ATCC 12441 / NRRL 1564) TaxID=763665 RepID=A0A2G5B9J0_COERN|nr:hypothetical protein COEREDRAFT_87637 [Coemansia reversa NRRL 1564]|eukprot:PIA15674.1 hypothetical protein COEREDRAFT_87637 [Coemansia reversa NRRL 1564]
MSAPYTLPEIKTHISSGPSSETPEKSLTVPELEHEEHPLAPAGSVQQYEDSLGTPESFYDAEETPYPRLLRFGPWWKFHSSGDTSQPKTRILPSVAAITMPITVLFVLTSVEANWVQSAGGFNGLRLEKGGGYVAGNAIATALAFLSAVTIGMRSIDSFRRYFTLRVAMFLQVLVNLLLGAVCVLTGAIYQRNNINSKHVWITPEYPCIYVGAALALFQAVLLLIDYATTPNFNLRGHGYGGVSMQSAIFLSNVVAIWTGFGSLVFSNVETNIYWHPYNSCFNAWVLLITTGATVLNFQTTNSKIFIFFWLPIGLLIMFVFFWCFGFGFVQRFDEKPLRRIREHEDRLRSTYREMRRDARGNKELELHLQARVGALQRRLVFLEDQRLRYFCMLFVVGVLLKICSWILASLIFTRTESDWSYWDSMVFLFFTLLTVGVQGMVPSSSTGMPMYHAYTFLDILCTAALDTLLLHILWNLAPWPRYIGFGRSVLASVSDKFMRRHRHVHESEIGIEQASPAAPRPYAPDYDVFSAHHSADFLEDAANVATRLRTLLVQNAASETDLREYDDMLKALETRIDHIHMHEKSPS